MDMRGSRNAWAEAAEGAPPRGPMRAQRNSSGQARQAAQEKRTQSLQAMAESLQLARETAHTLSMQSEQLGRTERTVDDAQYTVELSKHVMRGMTWSGWIYNTFAAAPSQSTSERTTGSGHREESSKITMGFICPECKVMFKTGDELATHYTKAHEHHRASQSPAAPTNEWPPGQTTRGNASLSRQTARPLVDDHDAFLRDLEPQLAELKEASLSLGNALDTQNHQLDRLDGKIECVDDSMKRVSVQAKKLAGRKLPVMFRFRCAFQETHTRKFLRDVNGEPVLGADVLIDGCTFRAYTLGDDTEIWGFQSECSSMFMGINRFGTLKIRGNDLLSYEQFAIDLRKPTTELFSFASCMGFGGWLVRQGENKLTLVRGTVANKPSAAQFKLVNLDKIQDDLTAS